MLLPARAKQRSGHGNGRAALITITAITAITAFLTRQRIAWYAYPDKPIGLTLRQVRARGYRRRSNFAPWRRLNSGPLYVADGQ